MRVSRYVLSERVNPWMAWVAPLAAIWPRNPEGAAPENPWMRTEKALGAQISLALDEYRKSRDQQYERLFSAAYEVPPLAGPVAAKGSRHALPET